MNLFLNNDLASELNRAKKIYSETGRARISNILDSESANELSQRLITQKDWNLVYNKNGSHLDLNYRDYCSWKNNEKKVLGDYIYKSAATQFQYFYKNIPVFDIYNNQLLPESYLNKIHELVNSDEFLKLGREITGSTKITMADSQATCYECGHFLTKHDDNTPRKNRIAAYVLGLSPQWKAEWGGLLNFHSSDGDIEQGFTPQFNSLCIFQVPQAHSVSMVNAIAPISRYSITGWLRG